jgi:hypothetical protein
MHQGDPLLGGTLPARQGERGEGGARGVLHRGRDTAPCVRTDADTDHHNTLPEYEYEDGPLIVIRTRLVQGHLRRQITSLQGGFQVIADLNAYHAFALAPEIGSQNGQQLAGLRRVQDARACVHRRRCEAPRCHRPGHGTVWRAVPPRGELQHRRFWVS